MNMLKRSIISKKIGRLSSVNHKIYRGVIEVCLALSLVIAGCAVSKRQPPVSPKKPDLFKLAVSEYPQFADDIVYDGLQFSIRQSISYLKQLPPATEFSFGKDSFTAAQMIRSLEHFLSFVQTKPSQLDLNKFIRSNYLVYKSAGNGNPGTVLFTGYYEPILEGSLQQSVEYKYPILAKPDDLMAIDLSLFSPQLKGKKIIGRYTNQTVVPYYARQDIEQKGVLQGKAKQLAWVKDRVDLFFLQIQGSGKIYLNNGQIINVHYDTSNGQPYRSIGNLLIEKGKIPKKQMSMQKIRAYLREHPEEVEAILNYNPSYVFFKLEKDGPFGCLGVKLTPGRSIATDKEIFPLAALAFIETKKPLIDGNGQILTWTDCKRFVLNHDTGGAIKGPGRVDLFWGNGTYAEAAAGSMQHPGNLYLLILNPDQKLSS